MKKTIEELIEENLHHFDQEPLPEEYLHNFQQRLETKRRGRHRFRFTMAVSALAAAVVALVMFLNIPVSEPDCNSAQTIRELQSYYESQQQRTIAIIEKLLKKVDGQTRAEIQSELAQMQIDDQEFRQQIRYMLPDEQYIAYEVDYYQTRQQSLEYIQLILQKR